MKNTEKDGLIWEKEGGDKGEDHSKREDPGSSLYCTEIHCFFRCILMFIVIDRETDSYEEEKHRRYNEVESIEGRVEGKDFEIVEIPKDVQDDHENNSESP